MTLPECTVIIPVYNSERFIEKTVRSVLNQTFVDFELIAIDDCSTDQSYEILLTLAKSDGRIRVFRNESNCGAAKTRNIGLDLAQGEYIALLDSDDLWLPEKLAAQIAFAREKKAILTYCSYGFIDKEDKNIGSTFLVPASADLKTLLKRNIISCSTVLAKREFFLRHKFNDRYYHEDFVAWIDMLRDCKVAYGWEPELAKIRIMRGTRSGDKLNSAKHRWRVYRKHLQMGVPKTLYYYLNYLFYSLIKYRKLKKEL